jgi:UDP-N-acetylmuramate dehydrogenase
MNVVVQIQENVSLAQHSTMALGGPARYMTDVYKRDDVAEAARWAHEHGDVAIIMIGHGSNIVWSDAGFNGLVIVNQIVGYESYEEDNENTYLTIGGGEVWDSVVERSVQTGLTGIEALSLIPGTAGATPVQNVGAYGQEIAQTLVTVEAYDRHKGDFTTIAASDCNFAYRTSRFKTTDRGRYFITALTLHLMKGNPLPPFYASVQTYLEQHNITAPTPIDIRQAVIAIRTAKLPNPAIVHNCGSFFSNPIVSEEEYEELAETYSSVPHWPAGDSGVKLSAAWLIEQTGFKGIHDAETGIATWPQQPLVLVNEHAKNTAGLLAFKQKVVTAVQGKFRITLEQEPELF